MRVAPEHAVEIRRSAADFGGVALLTALAAYLRIPYLGTRPLWMDEAAGAALARLPATEFRHVLFAREMNMAPYYLLLRWIPPLTHSEFSLRIVPAIFGVLCVPLLWIVALRALDPPRNRPLAFLVAAAAALNGFLIAYSQEARAYSAALFFLIAALLTVVRILRGRSSATVWAIYAVLALYCHFFTLLWLVPQFLMVISAERHNGQRLRTAIVVLVAGLLPLAAFAAHTRGGQLDWVPHLSGSYALEILRTLGGYSLLAASMLFAAAFVGVALFLRERTRMGLLFASQMLVPLLVLLLLSVAHPVFVPRFLMFILPATYVCAARAAQQLSPVLAIALAAPFFAATVSAKSHRPPRADWQTATAFLCEDPHRAIFFSPTMAKFPFEFYLRQHPGCAPAVAPGNLEPSGNDFFSGKKQLATEACASGWQQAVLVLDTVPSPSPAALTGNCYRETQRLTRDNLLYVWMTSSQAAPIK